MISGTVEGVFIGKSSYIHRVIRLHKLQHMKPVPNPLQRTADVTSLHEHDTNISPVDHARYISIVGKICYAEICIRKDLHFAVSVLGIQLYAPSQLHLILDKRVVRYIAGSNEIEILYPTSVRNKEQITAYTESYWAGFHESSRSTSAIIIKVNFDPV